MERANIVVPQSTSSTPCHELTIIDEQWDVELWLYPSQHQAHLVMTMTVIDEQWNIQL